MRKLILAGLLAALAVPAAFAQDNREAQDAAEKREKAALDRQYRNALKNVPTTAQQQNDPWAQMRAPSQPGAAGEKK
jgi:hypothetical protein